MAEVEKKAYAEITLENLTEEQELAIAIVMNEGALRERERIIKVLEKHVSGDVIKLIGDSVNDPR